MAGVLVVPGMLIVRGGVLIGSRWVGASVCVGLASGMFSGVLVSHHFAST
ncbi:MAG: hypothetical protein ABI601_13615 [bacterium]